MFHSLANRTQPPQWVGRRPPLPYLILIHQRLIVSTSFQRRAYSINSALFHRQSREIRGRLLQETLDFEQKLPTGQLSWYLTNSAQLRTKVPGLVLSRLLESLNSESTHYANKQRLPSQPKQSRAASSQSPKTRVAKEPRQSVPTTDLESTAASASIPRIAPLQAPSKISQSSLWSLPVKR